jgi:2-methylaconitate cis-trans-isomerase PrpF
VRIGTPSGVLTVGAALDRSAEPPGVERTMVYSTARRLMDGWVNAG